MNTNNDTKKHRLHALADGQLSHDARKEMLAELENDRSLRGDLCEIYHVKDLLQAAYPLEEYAQPSPLANGRHRNLAKVAGVVIALGVALGAGYTIRDTGLIEPVPKNPAA